MDELDKELYEVINQRLGLKVKPPKVYQ